MRDFKFDESEIEQQKKDLAALEIQEKDLWVRPPSSLPSNTY